MLSECNVRDGRMARLQTEENQLLLYESYIIPENSFNIGAKRINSQTTTQGLKINWLDGRWICSNLASLHIIIDNYQHHHHH